MSKQQKLNTRKLNIIVATRAVVQHGAGGMERHCRDLCKGLAERGHRITLITSSHPEGLEYLDQEGYRVHFLSHTPPGVYSDEYHEGVRDFIKTQHQIQPVDLLIAESAGLAGYLISTSESERLPVLCIIHGTNKTEFLSTFIIAPHLRRWLTLYRTWFKEYLPSSRISRAYLYKVNRVIAVGDYLAGESKKEYRLDSDHICVIRNGIDLNLYQPSDSIREATRRKLGFKSEDQVLLCIGRLSEDKGFSLALNSFAAVADLYPNAKILFVGDGEQRGYLEGLTSLHGLENRTIFTGRIQQSQTADYYAAADVLLIPSLRYEGLPYTLIEAAAFGMAIITTCHGGQGAEITNGLNGLLIRPDNQKDCVKALHKLLSDPSAIRRLGRNARQTAEERYDVNKMVEAFEVVSYEVIENDRLRSHS